MPDPSATSNTAPANELHVDTPQGSVSPRRQMRQEPVVDALIVGKAVHQDYRRILAGDLANEVSGGGAAAALRSCKPQPSDDWIMHQTGRSCKRPGQPAYAPGRQKPLQVRAHQATAVRPRCDADVMHDPRPGGAG
jgi:hypothetical protein